MNLNIIYNNYKKKKKKRFNIFLLLYINEYLINYIS